MVFQQPARRVAAKLSLRLTVLRRSKLDRFPFIDGDVADDADAVQQDGADSRHEPNSEFEDGEAPMLTNASPPFGGGYQRNEPPAAVFGRSPNFIPSAREEISRPIFRLSA
jgi:hypothetical protein